MTQKDKKVKPKKEPLKYFFVGEGIKRQKIEVTQELLDKIIVATAKKQDSDEPKNGITKTEANDRTIAAFHGAVVNGGNLPKAMLDAGYPKSMTTPLAAYNLSKSKSFKAIMSYYFTPDMLMEAEASLLHSDDLKYKDKALERIHKIMGNFIQRVELSTKGDGMKNLSDAELYSISQGNADIVEAEYQDVPNKEKDDPSTGR